MTNKNWGTIENGILSYAQDYVVMSNGGIIIHPTDEQYRAAGKLPVEHNQPDSVDGYVARLDHHEIHGGHIVSVYTYDKLEDPVYTYSKKKFFLALARRGIFSEVDSWMKSTEVIDGSGLTVDRLLGESTFMRSDDDNFIAIKTVAESRFGAAAFDAVLQESIDEEA